MTADLQAYGASVRLGWAISSNWTRPVLFAVYAVLRPVSVALILVVMYRVVTGHLVATPYMSFLVTGTAFWSLVQEGLGEFANTIAEDRGRYRMLKYAYISPQPFLLYLLGRVTAQMGSAAASVLVVLVFAAVFLRVPIVPWEVNYPLVALACALALVCVAAVGTTYALLLLAARESYGYGQVFAQVLYVVSGAIFPISALPGPLAAVAAWSPLAYWLELVRRALLGRETVLMFPTLSNLEVLARLGLSTAAVVVISMVVFRWGDRRARMLGLIDMESGF